MTEERNRRSTFRLSDIERETLKVLRTKTVPVKVWPPKWCQACSSPNVVHVFHEEHEGTTDWAYCGACKAEQVYWFQNVDEPSEGI